MKLNNQGWGSKDMFILMSILIAFLLFLGYLVYDAYADLGLYNDNTNVNNIDKDDDKEDDNGTTRYKILESSMIAGAKQYVKEFYPDYFLDNKTITVNLMKEYGYLKDIIDINDNTQCSGYVIVYYDDLRELVYLPYLNCSNYKTYGYIERYDY